MFVISQLCHSCVIVASLEFQDAESLEVQIEQFRVLLGEVGTLSSDSQVVKHGVHHLLDPVAPVFFEQKSQLGCLQMQAVLWAVQGRRELLDYQCTHRRPIVVYRQLSQQLRRRQAQGEHAEQEEQGYLHVSQILLQPESIVVNFMLNFSPQIIGFCNFLFCTLVIYTCYISSALYHQKILKNSYLNDITLQVRTFNQPIIFTFFPQLICALIGLAVLRVKTKMYGTEPIEIPWRKAAVCGLIVNVNMWTYNEAVMVASFPAVVMVKSCSLLSVILVGTCCTRVRDVKLKLSKSKIWIGCMVTAGILIFNSFRQEQSNPNDKSISVLGCLLLTVSLFGDGFLADFQAAIKAEVKPTAIDLYYTINKYTCLIALSFSLLTLEFVPILTYLTEYSELRTDVLVFSLLNALGQLAIYRMIKVFKQHIPSFVIATRKCFTVVVNIIYFHHSIVPMQIIGIFLVFLAVLLEVYDSYREKKEGSVVTEKAMDTAEYTKVDTIEKPPEDKLIIIEHLTALEDSK